MIAFFYLDIFYSDTTHSSSSPLVIKVLRAVNFTLSKVKTAVNKDVNFKIKKLDNGIFMDLRNKNLALDLWDTDVNGETWEYVFFLDEILV